MNVTEAEREAKSNAYRRSFIALRISLYVVFINGFSHISFSTTGPSTTMLRNQLKHPRGHRIPLLNQTNLLQIIHQRNHRPIRTQLIRRRGIQTRHFPARQIPRVRIMTIDKIRPETRHHVAQRIILRHPVRHSTWILSIHRPQRIKHVIHLRTVKCARRRKFGWENLIWV